MISFTGIAEAEKQMARVEDLLHRELTSDVPLMHAACRYALDAGGKRLRPALVLLCGHLCGAPIDSLLPAAAAVEMVHTATLLHDDIMDASPMRRGRLTVSRRWNPNVAVFAGDFILSRAFHLLNDYGRKDILNVFSEVTNRLCSGEVLQASRRHDVNISVADYIEIITCKTAHFLSCCCRVGGLIAGADDRTLDALSLYGTKIGLVFQITDDLLDYVGNTEETGKDTGADFREGKFTLPVIMALQSGDATAGHLRDLLRNGDQSDETFRRVRAAVMDSGAVERAHQYASDTTDAATQALDGLPAGVERDVLRRLALWITSRTV